MPSTVDVSLTPVSVAPGEELVATVTVGGDPRGVTVELLYDHEYLRPKPDTPDGDLGSSGSAVTDTVDLLVELAPNPSEPVQREVVVQTVALAPADGALAGQHAVRLRVPDDDPQSIARIVEWKVRATATQDVGAAAQAFAPLTVVVTAVTAQTPLRTPETDPQLELRLDGGQVVAAGQAVTGTVVLTPAKAATLTDVRIDLHHHRQDGGSSTTIAKPATVGLLGKVKLQGGERRELPFSITVPADVVPSFATPNARVDNHLAAVAARRMRSDFTTEASLFVTPPS